MQAIDRYRVVGNPIAHSKSPEIHALFAKQTDQLISYDKHLVELEHFAEEAHAFFSSGGKGMNITVPFKEDAYKFADALTQRAKLAGAVNTLALQSDGSILGDNTDGQGIVWDITERLGWQLKDKNILVLGAGGAVKGVLYMLQQQQPNNIVVANRTILKANAIAEQFASFGDISARGFESVSEMNGFDIIINGTSASLGGQLPNIKPDIFNRVSGAYDMVYSDSDTPFLRWASENGAKQTSDGLGMLIGQAAESFFIWRNIAPNTQAVYTEFRGENPN